MAEKPQTKTDAMLELAEMFGESVRAIVRDTILSLNLEQSCYCVVVGADDPAEDDVWSVRKADGAAAISRLANCTGKTIAVGDVVCVNYIGNDLANGYISRLIKKAAG